MSVSGDSFCTSGWHGFLCNLKHCIKFYFANDIAGFFVGLGVVFITLINSLVFYGLTKVDNPTKASPVFPIAAVVVLSYILCKICLGLFDDAVRAILMCYAIDVDLNNGTPFYGPPDFHAKLAKIMAKHKEDDFSNAVVMGGGAPVIVD